MRNFSPESVCVIQSIKKPLPFQTKIKPFVSDSYETIEAAIKTAPAKSIVIDDATYLMTNEYMRTAKVNGYQKFVDMALNFWSLVRMVPTELPDDVIVYFMGHVDVDQNGNEKFKTIGKMLDEKITLEGLFTIVLKTQVKDGKYSFVTQTNGNDTVKSPMGLFKDLVIDNDLAVVDNTIRDYYGIKINKKTEDKK